MPSSKFDLSTEEGQQKHAFAKLMKENEHLSAQEQARSHPKVGLERYLWKVDYDMIDGEKLFAYTSKEDKANLFHDTLGWHIKKQEEDEWTYQYSKCVYGDRSLVWINPDTKQTAEYAWHHPAPGKPHVESYPKVEEMWREAYVQKQLWWAFIAQRPPVETEKPRVLTAEFLKGNERLLPRHDAHELLKQDTSGIPKLLVEWVERSAREGPTAPPDSEASETSSAPAPV